MVEISEELLSSRLLEDDVLTIYSKPQGIVTYESMMNGDITAPAITVDKNDDILEEEY